MMISYERFQKEVVNRIKSYLPEEYRNWKVFLETEYKVNEKLDCLTLRPPETGAFSALPKFYLQDYYQMFCKGASAGFVLRMIASVIQNAPTAEDVEKAGFDILKFQDDVVLQVISRERNSEFLNTVPHRTFLDLAVICRILVFGSDGRWAGAVVNNSMLEHMGITEKALYERAYRHTMEALPLKLMNFCDQLSGKNDMLMLSNDSFQFGAAAMLYPEMLDQACEKLNSGIYILPGSIHELYIVREEPEKLKFYRQMVKQANEDVVEAKELLSDQVYRYDSRGRTVHMAL